MGSFKKKAARLLGLVILFGLAAPAWAQQKYDSFEDNSRRRVEQFIGRADRLEDEQAWNNYVELGIATERIQWETTAYEDLQQEVEQIEEEQTDEEARDAAIADAKADFEDARLRWESQAQDFKNEERGRFLAREEALTVARDAVGRFEVLIAAAEAQAAQQAILEQKGEDSAFSTTAPDARAMLADFDQQLNAELARARATAAGLTGVERQNFEEELLTIETDIRREFEVRKSFFVAGQDQELIALSRGDDLERAIAPATESADRAREESLTRARATLQKEIQTKLKKVQGEFEQEVRGRGVDMDQKDLTRRWEKQTGAILEEGLKEWSRAQGQFNASQDLWLRERGTPDGQERQAWTQERRELEKARAEWQAQIQKELDETRARWTRELENSRRTGTSATPR